MTITGEHSQAYAAGAVFGSYRLVRQIGAGGMGRVFIAEHIRLGRPVALKILRAEYSGNIEAVQRFFAEARAVNTINHENIIEVSDFIENPTGSSFYVMELLKGVDLRTLQQREGMLPLPRAVAIGIQVCRGLGAAHDAGIVHRDLKPDNIFLVEREGRKDFVKLLDFGVAKLMNAKHDDGSFTTSAGIAVGTPEYMSPEQTLGESVNHLADVYSTGIILFEMISGQRPFHANSAREVMVKHMTAHPPRVSKVRDYPYPIPAELDQLIAHCLKKEPRDRPLNIREVEQRLQKIALRLQQQSVTPLTVEVPLHRRRRLWVGVAGAALLLTATVALARRPRQRAAAPPVPSAQQEPGVELAPKRVLRVTFESEPPGATVFRARATQPVGVTPFATVLDASPRPEAFEFRLEGRQPVQKELLLAEDVTVKLTLPPIAEGASSATPAGGAAATASGAGAKRRGKRSVPAEDAEQHATEGATAPGDSVPPQPKGGGKTKPPSLDHGAVLDPFE